MNTSATTLSAQPKALSMSAPPGRARFWNYSAFVLLLIAGIVAFNLDRALREPDPAPGSPIERGPQPAAIWESTYDKSLSKNRDGPSERISVGALAPDFRLPDFADGHEVHLASFRGHKPVFLVFGSFSCNLFIGEIAKVKRLHEEHKDQADFLFV